MAQTFQYPNLLSGTRSGSGWGISVPGCADRPVIANRKAYKWAPVLDLQNSTSVENLLLSPPVTLHKDVDYTLSFVAAGTKNLAGLDVHVLDVDRSYDGWYVAGMYKQRPDGGGELVFHAFPPLGEFARRSVVQNPLRQQRQLGRQERNRVGRERHARGGHGASRVGTGEWGGVAVDER